MMKMGRYRDLSLSIRIVVIFSYMFIGIWEAMKGDVIDGMILCGIALILGELTFRRKD